MIRSLLLFTLACLSMGAPAQTAAEDPSPRKALFCPECWLFLNDSWDLDLQGRCVASGKKPVELEAVTMTWLWCRAHLAWHRQPCGRGSGVAYPGSALLVPDGSEPISALAYCPADNVIPTRERPGQACPICGLLLAEAGTVQREWFYCATTQAWLSRPCAAARRLGCCSPRRGPVLAHPWQIPILNDVSFTGR